MWYGLHVAGHCVQQLSGDVVRPTCGWTLGTTQLSGDMLWPTCGWTLGTTAEWWCTAYMWLDTAYNSWVVMWYGLHVAGHWVRHSWVVTCYGLHVAGHWVQQLSGDVRPTCGWTLRTTAEWWCGTAYMWLDTVYNSWVVMWYHLHVAGHWVRHSWVVTCYGLHVAGHWVQQLSGDVVRPTCGWTLRTTAE